MNIIGQAIRITFMKETKFSETVIGKEIKIEKNIQPLFHIQQN